MTHILFTNCTCSHHRDCEYNKGSAAVIIGAIKILKNFICDAKFSTFVQYSSDFSDKLELRVVPHEIHQKRFFSFYDSLKSSFTLLRAILWRIIYDYTGRKINKLINSKDLKEYSDADVIIDISMDLYSDDFGFISVFEHSKDLLCGALLGKKVVVFAQSIGPFKTFLTSHLARFTLNKVKLITVREEISMNNLKEIGVKTPTYLTADPAFLLEPAPLDRINEMFFIEGINPDVKPLIGLTISPTILTINKKKSKRLKIISINYEIAKYFLPEIIFNIFFKLINKLKNHSEIESEFLDGMKCFQELIDHLTDKIDATVILIPHTISTENELSTILGDDAKLSNTIYQTRKDNKNVKLIKGNYTTEELKGIIGQCDLFIGTKMHANIAALSQCIPAVAIAYSYKFQGIMKMMGQEKYICNEIATKLLISSINDAWVNKEKIRDELKYKVELVKVQSLFNGKLVKDLL